MKIIILTIVIILLSSCDGKGVETIKLNNGIKQKTVYMYDNLPEYENGDTVLVNMTRGGQWYITPLFFTGHNYQKAVVVKKEIQPKVPIYMFVIGILIGIAFCLVTKL